MNQPESSGPSLPALVGVAVVAMVVAAILSTVAFLLLDRYATPSVSIVERSEDPLVVQVSGAVATPGMYSLPGGARLGDLVDAAGGLSSEADLSTLNLAARIDDGEAIEIRAISETESTPSQNAAGPAAPLININTATLEELDSLPGVGPVIGQRIIDYRESNGPFQSVDELEEIDGISTSLIRELEPLVTVDG
jgi:competence protein ComEA